MFGGAGSDLLVVRRSRPTDVNIFDGGSGADQYFGGTGRDTYVISDQTGPGGFPDFVRIFGPGDKIDLSEFDLTRRERNPEEWRFAWKTQDGTREHVFHVFLPGNESARLTDADFMVLLGDGLPIRESFAAKLAFLHRPGNYIHRDGAVNAQEGTNRADRLAGRRGDDALDGRGGADVIAGKAGDDFLQGQAGADVIRGGAGKDRLFGGDGSDTLYGQAGKDTLSGGLGSDELIGGAGIDVFLLSYEDVQFQNGADTIIGFVLGEDRIELDQGLDPEGFRVRAEEDRIRFYLNEQTYEDYRHFLTVLVENATERILTLDDII